MESPWVFIGLTGVLGGGCAYMTGQAQAMTWRPMWGTVPYALLLSAASRFLAFALFGGELLSPGPFLLGCGLLSAVALAAYRITLARMMVRQYPWLYQRDGLFDWQEIARD